MLFAKATFLALLAPLTAAVPQTQYLPGVSALPSCATPALLQILTFSGCSATDTKCLCGTPNIKPQLDSAVAEACPNKADQTAVSNFAAGFCPDLVGSSAATKPASATTTRVDAALSSTASANSTAETTGSGNSTMSATSSMSSSTPTPTGSSVPTGGAVAEQSHLGMTSMFALAAALGGMTWVFAEL